MKTRAFKADQPVFFQKLPVTEKSPANAMIKRYVGEVQGETVVEIIHGSAKWLVKESELLDIDAAMTKRAEQLSALIEPQKAKYSRKRDLMKALGICESTFSRWNKIIQNYLPAKKETA